MSKYLKLLAEGRLEEAETARIEEIPKKLYKFVWLGDDDEENDKRFSTLQNQKIWITSIDELNDPYEYQAIRVDEEKLHAANYPDYMIQAFKDMFHKNLLWLGVSCLSEDGNKSMPMWAYYANNQKGFCIEYDVIDPTHIYKVSYEEKRVSVASLLAEYFAEFRKLQDKTGKLGTFNKHKVDQIVLMLRGQLHMKQKSWSHEKEFRILFPLKESSEGAGDWHGWNADLKYVGLRISRIIAGLNCKDEHIKRLNAISNELGLGIVWRQVLSETDFWEEKKLDDIIQNQDNNKAVDKEKVDGRIEEQKKSRIGIVTMYYNSTNYGGLLQAYALTNYLNDHGYDAKQITYDFYSDTHNLTMPKRTTGQKAVVWAKRKVKNALINIKGAVHGIRDLQENRRKSCRQFRNSIPHTDKVYEYGELGETIDNFDIFISGSDQVWNPAGFHQGFFLSFVDGEKKKKISYAASVSNKIPEGCTRLYRDALKDFETISVRENSDVETLKNITDKPVRWVLDPVFLLNKDEWNRLCSTSSRRLDKPYLFCYFLGDSVKQRKIAEEYGRKNNLIVVTIPYMQMTYRSCDRNFGDIGLMDVSPNRFLGLIRDAEVVLTDSFHATAFSIIFNKQFIAFEREGHPEMSERIKSITDLFGCCDRFLANDDQNIDRVTTIRDTRKEINNQSQEFEKVLRESKEVLKF